MVLMRLHESWHGEILPTRSSRRLMLGVRPRPDASGAPAWRPRLSERDGWGLVGQDGCALRTVRGLRAEPSIRSLGEPVARWGGWQGGCGAGRPEGASGHGAPP